jgi:hypothetical protein
MFICPKKIMMAILFMLLASSMAFQAVRSVLGGWIATAEGLPKVGGLTVHALVFMVLSTMVWRYVPFGSSNFEGEDYEDDDGEEYEDDDGEEYEDDDGEEYEDDDGEEYEDDPEEFARRRSKRSSRKPCPPGKVRRSVCRAPRRRAVIVAPGAAPMVTVPAAAAAPMVTVPAAAAPMVTVPATSMYGEQYVGYSAY